MVSDVINDLPLAHTFARNRMQASEDRMSVKPISAGALSVGIIAMLAVRLLPRNVQDIVSGVGALVFLLLFAGALIYRHYHPKPKPTDVE